MHSTYASRCPTSTDERLVIIHSNQFGMAIRAVPVALNMEQAVREFFSDKYTELSFADWLILNKHASIAEIEQVHI